jgi:hypothetical protein
VIRAEQIPDEVVEAAARTLAGSAQLNLMAWNAHARASIAAALNAWPDMEVRPTFNPSRIILPLTQEIPDD